MNGRNFDAQVLRTDPISPRGKLLSQFVLARINDMRGIDLRRFDFDRHNAVFYFIVNANQDIYLRYGGRNASSSDAYLNLDSLQIALSLALEEHQNFQTGKRPPDAKEKPIFPNDLPGLRENVVQRNRCVECHHIAHFETTVAENLGQLVKKRDLYRYPEIEKLGIHLNIPKGLLVARAEAGAKEAALFPGDLIQKINDNTVLTLADLQYRLDQVDRDAKHLNLAILRHGQTRSLTLKLPSDWWVTDLSHRNWTVNPLVFFEEKPLGEQERKKLKIPPGSFASRITEVPLDALLEVAHELKEGDIITAVDGKTKDPFGLGAKIYIKLSHKSGSALQLTILRGGKKQTLPLQTIRQIFRRVEE